MLEGEPAEDDEARSPREGRRVLAAAQAEWKDEEEGKDEGGGNPCRWHAYPGWGGGGGEWGGGGGGGRVGGGREAQGKGENDASVGRVWLATGSRDHTILLYRYEHIEWMKYARQRAELEKHMTWFLYPSDAAGLHSRLQLVAL